MKKKILIITHGFYPELSPRSFRATELAKEFYRQGHEVTVMAPYRIGIDELIKEYPFEFKSLGVLTWKIFNFKKFGLAGRLYNKAVNRLLPLLFEYPMLELFFKVRKALKNEKKKYDLLISVAVPYPIHWGVASTWNTKSKIADIWVADCGDPYYLDENDSFRKPYYFKYVEKWFMRKADFVSIPAEFLKKNVFPEFHSKIKIIPQGFKFEDVQRDEIVNDGIIRFGFAGSLIYLKRDPRKFLEFLLQLDDNFKFEFHIFTNSVHLLEPYIYIDKRIILHKPIDRIELLRKLSRFNFVVNFMDSKTQRPSKLIDYSILNLPILNIEMEKLDKNNILAFLNGDYTGRYVIENPDQYRIENICQKFLDLCK
ncbi:MAG: glycosyltransferase [Thermaurantimonas sp.]